MKPYDHAETKNCFLIVLFMNRFEIERIEYWSEYDGMDDLIQKENLPEYIKNVAWNPFDYFEVYKLKCLGGGA